MASGIAPLRAGVDDMIALPSLTAEDINPSTGADGEVDQVALQNLNSTPALLQCNLVYFSVRSSARVDVLSCE
jgi:hypothetical protein